MRVGPFLLCLFTVVVALPQYDPDNYYEPGDTDMGILQLKDGYFYDPKLEEYVIPHGMSYQTWNAAIFQVQTLEQIEYDLREMRRMHVNSVRVEFTYPDTEDSVYEFEKLDFLVRTAERYRLRLFVVIGHQYLPKTITDERPELLAVHYDMVKGIFNTSTILNYNSPEAVKVYQGLLSQVTSRYRDAPSVAAWVVGNELAFYDLWEDVSETLVHRFCGFDEEYSLPSYREHLRETYQEDIARLNAVWNTTYASFDDVEMALSFPPEREDKHYIQQSGYHDLIQWRKKRIGDFAAAGAEIAKTMDPNHLITFAQLGGIFDGNDANTNCEDGATITARCRAHGFPLDFWTINNYPWVITGSELRSGDFGISKFRDTLGIPLLVSETGMSDTDILLKETAARMAWATPSLLWESLMGGAIGIHIFHWSDRDFYLSFPFPFEREAGFGMVFQNRTMKPVWWNVLDVYRRMDEVHIERLLPRSRDPDNDLAIYWGSDVDLGYNRANQEIAMMWGCFKRMGLQPRLINDEQFLDQEYLNEPSLRAVSLPRNFQMRDEAFALLTDVVQKGVHLHSSTDLPGRFTQHHASREDWPAMMDALFGLDVNAAVPGFDSGVFKQNWTETYTQLLLHPAVNTSRSAVGEAPRDVWVWKYWREVAATHGISLYMHEPKGAENDTYTRLPVLHVTTPAVQPVAGRALGKTAAQLTSLGDTLGNHIWDDRRHFFELAYLEHFGLEGHMAMAGNGSQYVIVDWRFTNEDTTLLLFMNMARYPANFTVSACEFLYGEFTSPSSPPSRTPPPVDAYGAYVLEDLTRGRLVPVTPRDCSFRMVMDGDETVVLRYGRIPGAPLPLLAGSPPPPLYKVWLADVPRRVWVGMHTLPEAVVAVDVSSGVYLDVQVEVQEGRAWAAVWTSAAVQVSGVEERRFTLDVPVTLLERGVSTFDGAQYRVHARVSSQPCGTAECGSLLTSTYVPIAVLWGVKVDHVGEVFADSALVSFGVTWHELPSYLDEETQSTLDRLDAWPDVERVEKNDGSEAYSLEVTVRDRRTGLVWAQAIVGHSNASVVNHTVAVPLVAPRNASEAAAWLTSTGGGALDLDVEVAMVSGPPDLAFNATFETFGDFEISWEERERGMKFPEAVGYRWDGYVYSSNDASALMEAGVRDGVAYLEVESNRIGRYASCGWAYRLDYETVVEDTAVFSVGIRERSGLAMNVSIRLQDVNGNALFYSQLVEGSDGWQVVRARKDQFVIDFGGPSGNVSDIAYNNQTASIVINAELLNSHERYGVELGFLLVESGNNLAVPPPRIMMGQHVSFWSVPVDQLRPEQNLAPPLWSPQEDYDGKLPMLVDLGIAAMLAIAFGITVACTCMGQSWRKARIFAGHEVK